MISTLLSVYFCLGQVLSCLEFFNSQTAVIRAPLLGKDVKFGQIIKHRPSGLIKQPEDLMCASFTNSCRWRNLKSSNNYDKMDWYQAFGKLNFFTLFACTGKIGMPREPFAVMVSNYARPTADHGVLVSDPLPCQKAYARVTLKYWSSPNVEVMVCIKRLGKMYLNFDYCTFGRSKFGPATTVFDIPGPIYTPFEVHGLRGGYAIIDDIRYYGTFCVKEKPTTSAPMLNDIKITDCDLQYIYCIPELCVHPQRIQMTKWCQKCGFCTKFLTQTITPETSIVVESEVNDTTTQNVTEPNNTTVSAMEIRTFSLTSAVLATTTDPLPLLAPVAQPIRSLKCPEGFVKWDRKFGAMGIHEPTNLCYQTLPDKKTWDQAEKECAERGVILPSFRNEMEAVHFMSYVRLAMQELEVWIGLKDESKDGQPDDETWDDTYPYFQISKLRPMKVPKYRWEINSKNNSKGGCAIANKWKMNWSWKNCDSKFRVVCQTRLSLLPLYWNFPFKKLLKTTTSIKLV